MSWNVTNAWVRHCILGAAGLLGAAPVCAQPAPVARPVLSFSEAPVKITIPAPIQGSDAPAAETSRVTPARAVATPAARIVNLVPRAQVDSPEPKPLPAAVVAPPPANSVPGTLFPRAEPGQRRKTYTDLTAAPCFAHAPDYSWVIGQAEYSSISKQWRLRYASVDEFDRYGGHLVLIENQFVRNLRDGMHVHVHGHIVNPESAGTDPTYFRIDLLRPITNPNEVQQPTERRD
jgi:hypothetical protein